MAWSDAAREAAALARQRSAGKDGKPTHGSEGPGKRLMGTAAQRAPLTGLEARAAAATDNAHEASFRTNNTAMGHHAAAVAHDKAYTLHHQAWRDSASTQDHENASNYHREQQAYHARTARELLKKGG